MDLPRIVVSDGQATAFEPDLGSAVPQTDATDRASVKRLVDHAATA